MLCAVVCSHPTGTSTSSFAGCRDWDTPTVIASHQMMFARRVFFFFSEPSAPPINAQKREKEPQKSLKLQLNVVLCRNLASYHRFVWLKGVLICCVSGCVTLRQHSVLYVFKYECTAYSDTRSYTSTPLYLPSSLSGGAELFVRCTSQKWILSHLA